MGHLPNFEPLVEILEEEPFDYSEEEIILLEDPYCEECDLIFDEIFEKEEHDNIEHHKDDQNVLTIQKNDLHYCEVCDVINVSKDHIKIHKKDNEISNATSDKSKVTSEISKINSEKSNITFYKCDICDKQFEFEDKLKDHMDAHKVIEENAPRNDIEMSENISVNQIIPSNFGTHFMAFEEPMEINQLEDIKSSSSKDYKGGHKIKMENGNKSKY